MDKYTQYCILYDTGHLFSELIHLYQSPFFSRQNEFFSMEEEMLKDAIEWQKNNNLILR